jgi:ribonuclease J
VYKRTKKVYYKWEREFLDASIDAEFVRRNGRRLLLQLDLPHFAELIDIRPEAGSPYLHSMSEPFSEDDVDDLVLHNWIDHFGLSFHQFHASGHCSGPELRTVGDSVRARTIVPIHTEHPEAFASDVSRIVSPEKGSPIGLRP